jgi:hypothetical protein
VGPSSVALSHHVGSRYQFPITSSLMSSYHVGIGKAIDLRLAFGYVLAVALPGDDSGRVWKFKMKDEWELTADSRMGSILLGSLAVFSLYFDQEELLDS